MDLSGNALFLTPRRYLNGWSREQEELMAEWADKAACYRWLHDRCEKKFYRYNMAFTIPVIILSTLTGTANFAIGSLVGDDPDAQKYAQSAIGCISLIAGIISTIANFLRYAQGTEAHRVSGIAWGKFQRQIAVELAIPHMERIDCMDFLKICRAELDRLIEQSPAIPDEVIADFQTQFGEVKNIKKPEICHGLEHTRVYQDHGSRLKQITSEAALSLLHKKRVLREEIVPDLRDMIDKAIQKQIKDIPAPLLLSAKEGAPENTMDIIQKTRQSLLGYYSKLKPRQVAPRKETAASSSEIHIEIVGQETHESVSENKHEDIEMKESAPQTN